MFHAWCSLRAPDALLSFSFSFSIPLTSSHYSHWFACSLQHFIVTLKTNCKFGYGIGAFVSEPFQIKLLHGVNTMPIIFNAVYRCCYCFLSIPSQKQNAREKKSKIIIKKWKATRKESDSIVAGGQRQSDPCDTVCDVHVQWCVDIWIQGTQLRKQCLNSVSRMYRTVEYMFEAIRVLSQCAVCWIRVYGCALCILTTGPIAYWCVRISCQCVRSPLRSEPMLYMVSKEEN